jgi:hypothetical protein
MGFFAPWFLAGFIGVAVPIYVHLLRRHTTNPVPFSSLMFFERRTQSSIKHRRLRYLLLLSLRTALLVLLALAFANPFIRRAAAKVSGDKLLLLVLDNSFSMRAGTRLADARREALSVLGSRRPDEHAQVMALGSQLHVLTQPTTDPGGLRAAVESVQPSDSRASFGELAHGLGSITETVRTPIELHFFSDMQKSGLPANFAELALPANVSLTLHPMAKDPAPNWAVASVNAPGQVWDPKKSRVQVVVAGYGTPAATRVVSLVVNGKTIATHNVQVPAGGRATVEFESLDVPYGFSRCEVRIDSADALPADDASLFAVERSDPRRALFIHESNDARSPLYFNSALQSAAEAAFALDIVTPDQAANLGFSKYAFVVLSDVLSVTAALENELSKYVQAGGSLWIAAGTSMAHSRRVPVLGANIVDPRSYSRAGESFLMVGDSDPSHPSLEKAERWAGVKFYFAVRVDPGDARVAARLTDQTPLLLEKKMGEGTVLLFTSGFDNLTNDFPLHSVFVPYIEQSARYLSGTQRRSGSRVVDSFLELRNSKEQAVGVEVIDPGGHRPFSLKEASTAQTYQLTQAGFYELQLANGRHDVVGVNPDLRESNLDIAPQDTLTLWSGNAQGGSRQASSAAPGQEDTKPESVWWYIMVVVLGAAFAESLIANRHLAMQQEDE